MAFPLPDHVSAPVVAAVVSVIVGICPIITIMCTHPFVAEYENEAASPTGFILSYGSIFWILLLCPSFCGVLWAFSDDERRVVIDAHPKLVAHVTDRVAADLAQVQFCSLCCAPPSRTLHPRRGAAPSHGATIVCSQLNSCSVNDMGLPGFAGTVFQRAGDPDA
jgi:hypothetical protein